MRLAEYPSPALGKTWGQPQREKHRATKRAKALGNRTRARRGKTFYWRILTDDGYRYEHRVLMERLLGRPLGKHEVVHHVNGDGLDNRVENLRLVTRAEHNLIHWEEAPRDMGAVSRRSEHHMSKLTREKVLAIRSEYAAGGVRQSDLGEKYGVSQVNISAVVRRKVWKHV